MELTTRQKEVFNFVRTFIKERGYPPSVREIGQQFNIYPREVFDHLKALERKGYLKRKGLVSRGIEVLVAHSTDFEGRLPAGRPESLDLDLFGRTMATSGPTVPPR